MLVEPSVAVISHFSGAFHARRIRGNSWNDYTIEFLRNLKIYFVYDSQFCFEWLGWNLAYPVPVQLLIKQNI
jgi:hypothetical protein